MVCRWDKQADLGGRVGEGTAGGLSMVVGGSMVLANQRYVLPRLDDVNTAFVTRVSTLLCGQHYVGANAVLCHNYFGTKTVVRTLLGPTLLVSKTNSCQDNLVQTLLSGNTTFCTTLLRAKMFR